jgi:hypothetical protein
MANIADASAQKPSTSKARDQLQGAPATGQSAKTPEGETDEVKLLRQQLETMREYDQKLLSTVLWSLSGVFLLVILLGGYSWFSNFRIYNRDLESIRQQIRLDVQQEVAALRLVAAEERETSREKLADQFERLSATISAQVNELRSAMEDADSRRSKSEEQLRTFARETAASSSAAIRYEMNLFRLDVAGLKSYVFDRAKDSYQLLASLIEQLQVIVDLGWLEGSGHCGRLLLAIQSCLEGADVRISHRNHETLLELLKRVPEHLRAQADSIRTRVNNVPRI